MYSTSVCVWVRVCAHWSHRQTHGSLRSGEYYRGVDHRETRPITKRQAPHINPLNTDASVSPSDFSLCLLCLTPTHCLFHTIIEQCFEMGQGFIQMHKVPFSEDLIRFYPRRCPFLKDNCNKYLETINIFSKYK